VSNSFEGLVASRGWLVFLELAEELHDLDVHFDVLLLEFQLLFAELTYILLLLLDLALHVSDFVEFLVAGEGLGSAFLLLVSFFHPVHLLHDHLHSFLQNSFLLCTLPHFCFVAWFHLLYLSKFGLKLIELPFPWGDELVPFLSEFLKLFDFLMSSD
jgi:hypothetical protein